MKTDRRKFIRTIGAGATGLGLAATVPGLAAQTMKAAKEVSKPRKMIIRADDVGYTDYCNIGAFKTIEQGVVTSADVMMETPGTVDALERLKAFPWISVGWHAHFWGSPVLDPKQVPSMVIKEDGRIRFRKDLRNAGDVVFEQALMECRAQIDRCVKILGRAPDTGGGGDDSPLSRAMRQTCEEFGIAIDFASRQSLTKDGKMKFSGVDDKWADRKIIILDPMPAYQELYTDSITELEKYDPVKYYEEDCARLKDIDEDAIVEQSWHPGWVDYFVYQLGDYGPYARNFILARVVDVKALCSDRMKNWIKDNNIELVNFRDALYGTNEYQNHLHLIGSDLAIN